MISWENRKRIQYRLWRKPEGKDGPRAMIVKEYIDDQGQYCVQPVGDINVPEEALFILETVLGKKHASKAEYEEEFWGEHITITPAMGHVADEWLTEHKKTCDAWKPSPNPMHGGQPYHGAIGGATHWEIVHTSIGTLVNFSCTCGARTLVNGDEL